MKYFCETTVSAGGEFCPAIQAISDEGVVTYRRASISHHIEEEAVRVAASFTRDLNRHISDWFISHGFVKVDRT